MFNHGNTFTFAGQNTQQLLTSIEPTRHPKVLKNDFDKLKKKLLKQTKIYHMLPGYKYFAK